MLSLDLSEQEYELFNVEEKSHLELKNKNFIFGKNGAGKSTLCKMIEKKFTDEFDVRLFTGFENVVVDTKLNAVVLGEENIDAKKNQQALDRKLNDLISEKKNLVNQIKSLDWKDEYKEEGLQKHPLYKNKEELSNLYSNKEAEINKFYTDKARELREFNSPQITKPTYNRNDFIKDISSRKIRDDKEIEDLKNTLSEIKKRKITEKAEDKNFDFTTLINNVKRILEHEVAVVTVIEELKDNSARKQFAQTGLKIHKAGEKCSFCGNEITEDRIKKLETLVSIPEIQRIQTGINEHIQDIDNIRKEVNKKEELEKERFYITLHKELDEINIDIRLYKEKCNQYLDKLKGALNKRLSSIFNTILNIDVDIEIPEDFTSIEEKVNNIIKKHNELDANIEHRRIEAQKKLRLHFVNLKLNEKENYKKDWRGYEIEFHELERLDNDRLKIQEKMVDSIIKLEGSKDKLEENTVLYLDSEIKKANEEKEAVLKETKSTYKFVQIINNKLKKAGKYNLELTLDKDEDGIEHYLVKDDNEKVRSIDKLSTGEKNIIAFLYFLESLSDVEKQNDKNKIIVFDDPMNSNDDTMQYLIITEMQKLYTDKYKDKFKSQKDYFICLTHNAHFYLNIQPHGNFKDKKLINEKLVEISKYDKNNFYRLENGKFKLISSQKEDFNTHYELLWIELHSLYESDLLNSMLNSMRRIIETYIKFNKINLVNFYKDKEEHKKLFDVNSHSIDDHSMETIGKDKDTLIAMFKEVFETNNAIEHFRTYWK
ncbi:AAA family ATPase [Virgibacillus halodenitrificans]|uniref:AAA family ATPase n=1 Tax=Virgibacillus halodenitrificans TaxID=1482 RepID=UPI001FB42FE1|nr:AAA family ATPase [Virgibacillus halodenitrificans]MCJ0933156.1 AAA family ATPase [Virgibacillus halodenitrificans]